MKTIVSQIKRIWHDDGRHDKDCELEIERNKLRTSLGALGHGIAFLIRASQNFQTAITDKSDPLHH